MQKMYGLLIVSFLIISTPLAAVLGKKCPQKNFQKSSSLLENNEKNNNQTKEKSGKNFQSALNEAYVLAHNHIFPEDNFFAVQEGRLYRSRQLSGERFAHYIDKFGIKTIINLRGPEKRPSWWRDEIEVCRNRGVHHYDIPMSAKIMTPKRQLLELLYLYDNAPRPILIHCKSGADRTGEAAAIWVLDQMGRSNVEAARQLAVDFGHSPGRFPAKDFLIKIWKGRNWLINEYDERAYSQYLSRKFSVPMVKGARLATS